MPNEEKSVSMSELREILAQQSKENAAALKTVIEELKKPTAIEQKQLDAEAKKLLDANEERKANSGAILQQIENKRQLQRIGSPLQMTMVLLVIYREMRLPLIVRFLHLRHQ